MKVTVAVIIMFIASVGKMFIGFQTFTNFGSFIQITSICSLFIF